MVEGGEDLVFVGKVAMELIPLWDVAEIEGVGAVGMGLGMWMGAMGQVPVKWVCGAIPGTRELLRVLGRCGKASCIRHDGR